MSRCDTFMTEPSGDGRDVDPSWESMHGCRVSHDMGREVFGCQTGARGYGPLNRLC